LKDIKKAIFLFLLLVVVSSKLLAQKTIDYPELGIKFSIPAETDDNGVSGVDLFWGYFPSANSSLELTIGFVNELDPEYEVENPFDVSERTKGPYPSIDIKRIKGLTPQQKMKRYAFSNKTNYIVRYYFPLGSGYYFMLDFDGSPEEAQSDEAIIKQLLQQVTFYPPSKTNSFNYLNQAKGDRLTQKMKSSSHKAGKGENISYSSTSSFNNGKALVFFPEFGIGTVFMLLDEAGNMNKTFFVREETIFFEVIPEGNSFVALVGKLKNQEVEDLAVNHCLSLQLSRYDYNGKLLTSSEIMPEVQLRNSNQVGFIHSMENCVSLSKLGDKYLAHFPVMALAAGRTITNQKDVPTYFSDINQFCSIGVLNSFGLTRQGDFLAVLDANGKVNNALSQQWHTTDSWAQQVQKHNEKLDIVTLNGTGKNRGVALKIWDGKQPIKNTIETCLFPANGVLTMKQNALLELSEQISIGATNFLAISSEEASASSHKAEGNPFTGHARNDLFLIAYQADSKKLWAKNITQSANTEEIQPHLFQLEQNLVLIWTEFGYLDQMEGNVEYYMILNQQGKVIQRKQPFMNNSALILKKLGNDFDISSNDMPNLTRFISTTNGQVVSTRIMPYFYMNYVEVLKFKP
jgi:hypothetical protein